jgi:hypothetical protein
MSSLFTAMRILNMRLQTSGYFPRLCRSDYCLGSVEDIIKPTADIDRKHCRKRRIVISVSHSKSGHERLIIHFTAPLVITALQARPRNRSNRQRAQ